MKVVEPTALRTRQARRRSRIPRAVAGMPRPLAKAVEIELGGFLLQACGLAMSRAEQTGMSLSPPPPEHVAWVQADPRRLRQCMDHLLSSAFKYGRSGARIEVQMQTRGDEVTLAVQDDGDGFSNGPLMHLFEPYDDTGSGLTLTRELVQAMGGRLQMYSEGMGSGSRVELTLPAASD